MFIQKSTETVFTIITAAFFIPLVGCGSSSSNPPPEPPPVEFVDPEEPEFNNNLFSDNSSIIDNPNFPLVPGQTYIYEGDGERIEVSVSHQTRIVAGIESVIVVDRAYEEGELVEETFDWYAQDMDGNVWYMGEDSKEIEEGEVVSTEGSWETGLDIDDVGFIAAAGIQMKVAPYTVGDTYFQEFYETVAEDKAEIIAEDVLIDDVTVAMPDGSVSEGFLTLHTKEWVPLEDDPVASEEFKYFAPGIGLILETDTAGEERIELISISDDRMPNISVENFSNSTLIDNQYFPLTPGTTLTYQTTVGEDQEIIIIDILADTREVMGITTVVVRDRVYINGDENTGLLVEDTHDWFAQDDDGNVWYMGEDVDNYDEETGEFLDNEGAWEAGVDGAVPGIQMKATPRVGDSYHQEYWQGEAEDLAAIVGLDVALTLADDSMYSTLKAIEWNPLEEDSTEFKYFAPGIGFIREEKLDESGEVEEAVELISIEVTP